MRISGRPCRERHPAPSPGERDQTGSHHTEENHDGQVPAAEALPRRPGRRERRPDGPVDARRRSSAHIQYMQDFADRLERSGEFVDGQALAPEGQWVQYDGEGKPPVTDGPFAETKDLIAGWMIIDVDSHDRAVELAGELSAAPGAGGRPIHEWLELRPVPERAPDHHRVT